MGAEVAVHAHVVQDPAALGPGDGAQVAARQRQGSEEGARAKAAQRDRCLVWQSDAHTCRPDVWRTLACLHAGSAAAHCVLLVILPGEPSTAGSRRKASAQAVIVLDDDDEAEDGADEEEEEDASFLGGMPKVYQRKRPESAGARSARTAQQRQRGELSAAQYQGRLDTLSALQAGPCCTCLCPSLSLQHHSDPCMHAREQYADAP